MIQYMDVFEWYVVKELVKHHEDISKRASSIASYQRTYNKKKTMIDDFFIPVRKIYARIAQHYAIR